jgi:hypothetical protein
MPYLNLEKELFVAGVKFPAGPREIGGGWAKLLIEAGAKGLTKKQYDDLTAGAAAKAGDKKAADVRLSATENDGARTARDADDSTGREESALDSVRRHQQGRPYRVVHPCD